ncbi:MAG: hypothetical protein HY259_11555 [Chloroflexi bacterium]|nr:hypothetical protein [Chloroflexota bacterium]MBI3734073.1 hypothetical protein [Chloroflexota bacterium]
MSELTWGQRRRVAQLYDDACAAIEQRSWQDAVYKLERVLSLVPDFPGAAHRILEARRCYAIHSAYERGCKRMGIGLWLAARHDFHCVLAQADGYRDSSVRLRYCDRQIQSLSQKLAVANTHPTNSPAVAKAGTGPNEAYTLYRFQVPRHA